MKAGALALVLLLAGCTSAPVSTRALSVGQAMERQDSLDGQLVMIDGVMGECSVAGCELHDAAGGPDVMLAGGDAAFAAAARQARGQGVTLQGRFDGSCLRGMSPKAPEKGLVACVGRGAPMRGARIIAVR